MKGGWNESLIADECVPFPSQGEPFAARGKPSAAQGKQEELLLCLNCSLRRFFVRCT
jgi:hypothetical protein